MHKFCIISDQNLNVWEKNYYVLARLDHSWMYMDSFPVYDLFFVYITLLLLPLLLAVMFGAFDQLHLCS